MGIFTYADNGSLIDEVTFHKTPGGAVRASLHVRDGAAPAQLQPVLEKLHKRCWQAVPTSERGRPELEVRGFRNEAQLLSLLRDNEWIKGEHTLDKSEDEHTGFVDKVRNKSLFASSLLYFIGDYKFWSYGHKSRNALDMAGGVFYFAGSLSSFLFGRKDSSDLQVHELSEKIADHVDRLDVQLPPDTALTHILSDKHKGTIRQADDLLRRYPAELMNTFFGIAGICIATAAYKKLGKPVSAEAVEEFLAKQIHKHHVKFPNTQLAAKDIEAMRRHSHAFLEKMHKISNRMDIGLGSLTATSGTIATLIPEKTADPDAPPKHGVEGGIEWLKEHPMSIAGVGYMIATMCHAASTAVEYKVGTTTGKEAIMDRGIFVLTNLMAEFLVSISSKGHGEGVVSDRSVDNTAIAVAADLIAKQPAHMQPQLIGYMAKFLGRPDVLAMKDQTVYNMLQEQVEDLRKNPWAQAGRPATPLNYLPFSYMQPAAAIPMEAAR